MTNTPHSKEGNSKMMYIYKNIRVAVPHCPKCKEQLKIVNNTYRHYSCSCGAWLYDWLSQDYSIVPTPKEEERDK